MSANDRGGIRQADAFYSAWRRPFDMDARKRGWRRKDIRTHMLAPVMDGDWWWYDGDTSHPGLDAPTIVACVDTKLAGERWTMDPPHGNGMQAMANLGPAAFVLEIDLQRGCFAFVALNAPGQSALMAMREWCSSVGQRIAPLEQREVGERKLLTMTVRERGHWHFEMLTRARFRGEDAHDAAEVDRRLRVLRATVALPQRAAMPMMLEPFGYGPTMLASRERGAAGTLEPIAFHVAQMRDLLIANGRTDLVAELDEFERRVAMMPTAEQQDAAEQSNVVVLERIRERRALLELRADGRTPEESADELRELLRDNPLRGLRTAPWNLRPDLLETMAGFRAVGQQTTARFQGIGREMERASALVMAPMVENFGRSMVGLNAIASRQLALLEVLGLEPDDDSAA